MAIAPADRRLLLIAGIAFLLLLCFVAFLTPGEGENEGATPSSYSSSPAGARAAFLLLEQLGLPVERWENSPVDLPSDSSRAVLVLANPAGTPNKEEQQSLRNFVQSGGRILFTGAKINDFFPDVYPVAQLLDAQPKSFSALVPSSFTRNATTVTFRPEALWGEIDGGQLPLYGDSRRPVAVSWRTGAGHVLWWAGPTPLTNAYISKEQNLNLFLDAVAVGGNLSSAPVKIYWDEYFHGERESLWAYAANTPLPWGLLQLGILGLAIFLTFGLRSGPLLPAHQVPRLWPLEFIDTLGELYERAAATSAAVDVVYRNCRAVLCRRLNLRSDISDAALGQAVVSRIGWARTDLTRTIRRAVAAARGERIAPSEALELVQELEYCRQQVEFNRPRERKKP
jgi:hypothetical protein